MNYGGGFDMGASQFAGGGFVPSPAPGTDNGYGGQQKGGGGGGKSMAQTMRDVTVRQLLRENAGGADDQILVDGIELTTFFIVGRVVSRHEISNILKLKVDDGTGVIEVTHYMEDSNELINASSGQWQVNAYIRVCGNLRPAEHKKSMLAFRIKLVKDFNEITYHNLQCIFQHLHLTKGVAPPGAGPQGGYGGPASAAMPGTGTGGTMPPTAAYAPGPGPGPAGGAGDLGSKIYVDVVSVYNESVAADQGLKITDVVATLQQRGFSYTLAQVQEAVEFLTNEGQLYSTIDDHHHRSTAFS